MMNCLLKAAYTLQNFPFSYYLSSSDEVNINAFSYQMVHVYYEWAVSKWYVTVLYYNIIGDEDLFYIRPFHPEDFQPTTKHKYAN